MRAFSANIVPALGYNIFTPYFDAVMGFSMRENHFKRIIVEKLGLAPGDRLLDIGSGTGTLAIMAKSAAPGAEVIGFDADAKVLELARRKAFNAGVPIDFQQGLAHELPYEDHTFTAVTSSLLFHHLVPEQKITVMAETFRVLDDGGRIVIADWGKPSNALMRGLFLQVQLLDGFANTKDHTGDIVPELMTETGFQKVTTIHRLNTIFGTLSIYNGVKGVSNSGPAVT